uniref:SOCS box domain-containing protein n=1 Tax=Steinernema glaseri TaxID=37863 RepID=A0A1I7YP91_9BILA
MGANHEFQLKFLLVGDSDVGKNEILDMLPSENQPIDSPLPYIAAPKETTILLEGKRVRLHLWDTSGQGRFSTIIRSYSRGAEGLLIVYDITNRWSFEGIKRWLVEIDEHAPGIPRILVGNRLHLEFKRAIPRKEVENFAAKRNMEYFEVSTLAFFNVKESLTELARLVISRNGMHRLWRCNRVPSLQELSCRSVVKQLETVHAIDRLPLPLSLKYELRSFARGAQCYTYTLPKTKKKQIRLTLSEMSARQVASRSPKNCYAESCRHERERQRAKGCVLM